MLKITYYNMEEYTNRELGILLKNLHEKIDDLTRVVKGNGKKGLTDRVGSLENWRWYVVGGGSVILFGLTMMIRYL